MFMSHQILHNFARLQNTAAALELINKRHTLNDEFFWFLLTVYDSDETESGRRNISE